jgi:hypothetical protein
VGLVRFSGKVEGTSDGSNTTLELNAVMHVDLRRQCVTWLQMKFSEDRGPGHLTHGYAARSDFRMLAAPATQLPDLQLERIALLLKKIDPTARLVTLTLPATGIQLNCQPGWQVISDTSEGAILRLVDKGDLIAQANLSRLPSLASTEPLGLEEFQNDIRRALGNRFGQFEQTDQSTAKDGQRSMKVVVVGAVQDVPIRWIYHHITDTEGARAALLFTLEQDLVERFGDADMQLVGNLECIDHYPSTPQS